MLPIIPRRVDEGSMAKNVGQTVTANDSKNSLLLLAVLRCYSAAAVPKDAAFLRLRRAHWLLVAD